jgi:hypothetical protein
VTEYRATVDGNTYALRTRGRGKRERVLGGSWVKGKAQNLTRERFQLFLVKMLEKLHRSSD